MTNARRSFDCPAPGLLPQSPSRCAYGAGLSHPKGPVEARGGGDPVGELQGALRDGGAIASQATMSRHLTLRQAPPYRAVQHDVVLRRAAGRTSRANDGRRQGRGTIDVERAPVDTAGRRSGRACESPSGDARHALRPLLPAPDTDEDGAGAGRASVP